MLVTRGYVFLGLVCAVFMALIIATAAVGQDLSPMEPRNAGSSAAMISTPQTFAKDLASAQQGDVAAQLRVGKAYYFGRYAVGSGSDYANAYKWFETAYEKGAPEAATWVGACYVYGYGVPRDVEYGETLVQTAAQKGDSAALTYMGFFYLRGLGVPKDEKKAMAMFLQASASGNPIAELNLARMYKRGFSVRDGVIQYTPGQGDNAAAVKWYQAAAASHQWAAEFELGQMAELGLGTPKDMNGAQSHYLAAARKGYVPAQLRMGEWHQQQASLHGDSSELVNAYKWYALASQNGSTEADQRLAKMDWQLTPEQRKEAIALVGKYSSGSQSAQPPSTK